MTLPVQLDALGTASITNNDIDGGSTDACGIASTTIDNNSFSCNEIGANTITLTVIDNNSNQSTCTATVTVEDNVSPTAICQDITIQLDANGIGTIAEDAVNNGSSDACGGLSFDTDITSFGCSDLGIKAVILTVSDQNNNVGNCTALVTIEDDIAPIALCQDITVSLDQTGMSTITGADIDNGSNDACGIASLTVDHTNFSCSDLGNNTVTLSATDNSGNTSTCSATVTIDETSVAPIAICQDITIQLDGNNMASITATDVDNGSVSPCNIPISSLAIDIENFGCAEVGPNAVTLTVTDANNNISTCTATVTVEENQAPQVTCNNPSIILYFG